MSEDVIYVAGIRTTFAPGTPTPEECERAAVRLARLFIEGLRQREEEKAAKEAAA